MRQAPGTVSRILWHFTGGPKWNTSKDCQEKRPKLAEDAYHALLSIIRSKQLSLGGYREVVKVHLPKLRRYNKKAGKMEHLRNITITMKSSPVCCLSDIPIAHLSYHAERYGKFAIGFHREAAIRHGFNPVFYTLYNTDLVRSVRNVLVQLRKIQPDRVEAVADDIRLAISDLEDLECDHDRSVEHDLDRSADDLEEEAQDIEDGVDAAQTSFREFFAFIKTFDKAEFSSVYCEREWRSTRQFPFEMNDLAMIVLPRRGKGKSYFDDFVKRRRTLTLPRSIPVVPWEDLIEH